ncbi:MAG: ankyrin repeat domain-containing protein [Alphaproteobacteria bacterium]
MVRLNGDLMRYKGEKIMWWKLRDLFIGAAQGGNVEELRSIVEEYPEAPAKWVGGLFGTVLFFAAQEGKLDAVKFLMENGAKPGVAHNDGLSPLVAAAFHGHAEVVEYLVKQGADVDETDDRIGTGGYTALAWAAYHGHPETARCLLERGANSGLKNDSGKTARQIAVERHHPEVAAVIDSFDTGTFMYKAGTEDPVKVSKPISFKMK